MRDLIVIEELRSALRAAADNVREKQRIMDALAEENTLLKQANDRLITKYETIHDWKFVGISLPDESVRKKQ